MARNRTLERRREREREKRRQQQITLVVVMVAVAVIAVLALILANQPAEAPIPDGIAERYTDIPQDKTEQGFPRIGNPDAPVNVLEITSYDCPHCRDFNETTKPAILERVKTGQVVFTIVPIYGTGGIENGEGAARAAICAGEQNKFWEFSDTLFNWQGLYGNQSYSQGRIRTGIDNLGVNRAEWDQCMGSDLPGRAITAARTYANNLPDFSGTPTVMVNGINVALEDVITVIDEEIARNPVVPSTATVEATAETTPETVIEATVEVTTEATNEATPEATP